MRFGRSKYLPAILAIACAVALPIPAYATVGEPTITLKVNGADTAFQGAPQFDPVGEFWSSDLTANGTGWSLSGLIFFFEIAGDRALIDYSLSATSTGSERTSFSLNLSFPFAAGPYTILQTDHGSTIDDNGSGSANSGSVMAEVNDFSFIHNPMLNGSIVAGSQISTGCSLSVIPNSHGAICQSLLAAPSIPVLTQANGILGLAVSFKVSAYDTFHPGGNLQLVGVTIPVPEPGTHLALLAGLLGIVGAIARRRIR